MRVLEYIGECVCVRQRVCARVYSSVLHGYKQNARRSFVGQLEVDSVYEETGFRTYALIIIHSQLIDEKCYTEYVQVVVCIILEIIIFSLIRPKLVCALVHPVSIRFGSSRRSRR